jgi:two-component system, chemotaxis family, sensor kinase CheA
MDASVPSSIYEVETEPFINPLELEPEKIPLEQGLLMELKSVLTPIFEESLPLQEENQPAPQKAEEEKTSESDTVEKPDIEAVPTDSNDALLFAAKEGSESPAAPALDASFNGPSEKVIKHNLRVDTKKIDILMNQVGELVVNRAWFSQLSVEMKELQRQLQENKKLDQKESKQLKSLAFRVNEATLALGRVANDLQEGVMKVRMLPIAQLFSRYPRLVRQLAQETGKQVRLEITGEETELDKMVIEEVSDPLVHILRNAVDHGIESADDRRRLEKSEEATVRLAAYHESNHVVIEVSDDGKGIDPKLLRETALAKGISTESELDRMTPKELFNLIMKPGFSTAAQVTKTSGRGVGMDVVKKNIEKLNGTIEIDSTVGVGTRFRIKIPLTLAIIQALLVRVGAETFTIPLTSVVETLRLFKNEINTIEGLEVIHLRQTTVPLVRLSKIFRLKDTAQDSPKAFVVIISTGIRQVGLVVDSLIGEQEVVIKPLVDYLQENSGFSGATILGDGRISLILDVYELVALAVGRQAKVKNGYHTAWENLMSADNHFPGIVS